jgi:cation diffusion facilitator CzcD-associated flavoprotein CzcO
VDSLIRVVNERLGPPIGIIGAGPGGLSVAAALRARGIPFEILDAGSRVGGIWDIDRPDSPMYESAHFISSRTLSGFPGFPMPDSYPDYPRHDQVLRYIRDFAGHHDLERHITFDTRVESATRTEGGGWAVNLDSGEVNTYDGLCVATGMNWHPRVPELPGEWVRESYHSSRHRSADDFRGKRVLIVGAGNSGCDIACDAARSAERAFISVRRGYHFVPKYVFGKPSDVFAHTGPALPAWLEERVFGFLMNRVLVGDLTRYGLPAPDHPILRSHPIMNTQVLHHLGHGDLQARPDVRALRWHEVEFTDGSTEEIDLIVWATGYERVYPFLAAEDLDLREGALDFYLNVFHRRYPDLFVIGLFETDGAAYGLFGAQAELIAAYLEVRSEGTADVFDRLRIEDRPDLRGGRKYLSSARHAYYVKGDVYERALRRARSRLE